MKENSYVKSKVFIAILLIVTGVFTACGKSDKEDIARDLSENVTSDTATESDAVQEKIPESLSYAVVSRSNGAIQVNAEVYAEGYGQVPTYKLRKRDKNGEWLKSYAEKLFDNGEYINVKPYDSCSMEELEDEKQFWEERLMALDESSRGYGRVQTQIHDIEYAMEQPSASKPSLPLETDYSEDTEEQLIFSTSNLHSEDNSTTYYERAQLRGEVDGNVWLLNYDYTVYESGGEFGSRTYVPVLYGSCVEKMDYISDSYGMELGIYENKCDRTEAEHEAAKLIDRLGFNNMECVKMIELRPSVLHDSDEYDTFDADDIDRYSVFDKADYLDGYCITYGPSLNEIKMFSCFGSGASTDGETIAVQPYVSVLVNSEGAYSFCIMEDYDIEEKLSENSQMLSFQQIDDIARAEFEKMMAEYPNVNYEIAKVKFEYLCITYDGISYAMLPVWSYYMELSRMGDADLYPLLIVNALDGAVISSRSVSCNWEYYSFMK